MRPSKLDVAVGLVALICLAGAGIVAEISDPAGQPLRVAYLFPANGGVPNVWTAEIGDPASKEQLTFSEFGVYDFDLSPDGNWLAFSERTREGVGILRLLELPERRAIEAFNCIEAAANCGGPVFSPDGSRLAYERSESLGNAYGLPRIWLIDMQSPSFDTVPLIADTDISGRAPVWAAEGNTLAFYSADSHEPGILIYEFVPHESDEAHLHFIPSSHGTVGTISPDGLQIIFPEIVRRGEQHFAYLRKLDLQNKEYTLFTDPEGPTDDVTVRWSPDGATVALARKYTDNRWTAGHQLYLRSSSDEDDTLTPVVFNERYSTSYFRWNQKGDRLVMQRFPLVGSDGAADRPPSPEVWIYDLKTGESSKIAENAYVPRWLGQ